MTTIDNASGPPHALGDAADNDLVLRSRSGDRAAFGELWRRHYRSGLSVARSMTASLDADDLVQEAYARIYQSILRGGGPDGSFRAYLFTSIRNTAAGWGRARKESAMDDLDTVEDPASSEQETAAALDRSITVRAFRSLPSRWQEVLWYSEIERMKPAEIAPLLGMKATAVAQLTFRAREGLREAWIQAHLQTVADGSECQWTIERLGAFARTNLGTRDRAKVEVHLANCARCGIVAAEAKEVSSHLALLLIPLTVGITGTAAYLAAIQGGGVPIAALAAMPSGIVDGAIVVHGGAGVAGAASVGTAAASATGATVGAAGAGFGAGAAGAGAIGAGTAGAGAIGAGTAGAGAIGAGAAGAGAIGAGTASAVGTAAVGAGLVGTGTLTATAATAGAVSAGAAAATTAAVTTVAASAVAATSVAAAGATATGGVLSAIGGMIGLMTASAVLVGSVAAGATLPADTAAPPSSVQQSETQPVAAPSPGDIGFLGPTPAIGTADIILPAESTITVEPVRSEPLPADSTIVSDPVPVDLEPVEPVWSEPLPADSTIVSDPVPVDLEPVDATSADPAEADPAPVDPATVDPGATDPTPAGPAAEENPVAVDPVSVDPAPASGDGETTPSGDPGGSDPNAQTDPASTDPGSAVPDEPTDATGGGGSAGDSGAPAAAPEPTDFGAQSVLDERVGRVTAEMQSNSHANVGGPTDSEAPAGHATGTDA